MSRVDTLDVRKVLMSKLPALATLSAKPSAELVPPFAAGATLQEFLCLLRLLKAKLQVVQHTILLP